MIESRKLLKSIVRMPPDVEKRVGRILRLDKNERTIPFAQEVIDEVWGTITPEEIVAYPELEPLYQKLSQSVSLPRENLLLCSGSDTGIKSVFEVYGEEGDEVISLTPSYGMFFVYCDIFGAVKVPVEYNDNFSLPIEKVINKINARTKLIILANPNHTGTVIDQKDLCCVVECAARNNTLVLIDEAYYGFYSQTMCAYVNEYNNLIIVRSFSKAYGMAGLRVGYLMGQSHIIRDLSKVRLTHEITSISAKFAEYFLLHPEVSQNYCEDIEEAKKYLNVECQALGITVIPSVTNFIFLRLTKVMDAARIVLELRQRNIYIKGPFKGVPMEGLIRITLGPIELMREFMNNLKEIIR